MDAADAAVLEAYFAADFENKIIGWKKRVGGGFQAFLRDEFPENIRTQPDGAEVPSPRCMGEDWKGTFERLTAAHPLHVLGPLPTFVSEQQLDVFPTTGASAAAAAAWRLQQGQHQQHQQHESPRGRGGSSAAAGAAALAAAARSAPPASSSAHGDGDSSRSDLVLRCTGWVRCPPPLTGPPPW